MLVTNQGCTDAAAETAQTPLRPKHEHIRDVEAIGQRHTSAFRTSIVLSLDAGPIRSISWLRLSALHTETRFPVVLCVADCTFHGPTLNGSACAVAAGNVDVEGPEGPGVDDRLPVSEGPPMLYDCEMFVRAKKEVAAASILERSEATSPSRIQVA